MTHVAYCLNGILERTQSLSSSVVAEQSRAEQSREKMIGVKRPAFKLGNPKPPKSAKKKKALKETKPLADPDDATVIANPYAEYMVQKPSELMNETPKPVPDCEFGPPFDGLYERDDPSDQASCSLEPVRGHGLLD